MMLFSYRLLRWQKLTLIASYLLAILMLSPAVLAETSLDQQFNQFSQQAEQSISSFNASNEAAFAKAFIQQWQSFNDALEQQAPMGLKPSQQPRVLPSSSAVPATTAIKPSSVNGPSLANSNIMPKRNNSTASVSRSDSGFFGHTLIRLPLTALPQLQSTDTEALLRFRREALQSSDFAELLQFYPFMIQRSGAQSFAQAQLAEALCRQYYAHNSAVACAWLLAQSQGLDVRLALRQQHLLLLASSTQLWYQMPYFTVAEQRLYVLQADQYRQLQGKTQLQTHRHADATELLSIQLSQELKPAQQRNIVREKWQQTFTLDPDHIAFLQQLPQLEVQYYLHDEAPAYLRQQLLRWLQGSKKTPLAHFKQRLKQLQDLPYQLDETQFGQEQPLTISELIYFPYSDCEDRVYALASFNRLAFGLSLSALLYPNHLSAAIRIDERWIEADPTYQGASLGMTQPPYQQLTAQRIP